MLARNFNAATTGAYGEHGAQHHIQVPPHRHERAALATRHDGGRRGDPRLGPMSRLRFVAFCQHRHRRDVERRRRSAASSTFIRRSPVARAATSARFHRRLSTSAPCLALAGSSGTTPEMPIAAEQGPLRMAPALTWVKANSVRFDTLLRHNQPEEAPCDAEPLLQRSCSPPWAIRLWLNRPRNMSPIIQGRTRRPRHRRQVLPQTSPRSDARRRVEI